MKAEFFDSAGTQLVVPHKDNVRKNSVQIVRYKESIKKFGNIQGVRGQAVAVLSEGNKPPWRMLTYGSVSRAIYAAHAERWVANEKFRSRV